ncbi:hypothetical protein CEV34_3005 [Brucella pseudogrignonensis]|uniref:Uncharacterized protein n=1 Tax=Brucella pseudogrignonensis TaxID=419475 RepID=A0A256GDR8_9HYPH|nr:hypothetical protein CEV34_3005 [Brucella pseudogrignonensis]
MKNIPIVFSVGLYAAKRAIWRLLMVVIVLLTIACHVAHQ